MGWVFRLYDVNTSQCFISAVPSHHHNGAITSIKLVNKDFITICLSSNVLRHHHVSNRSDRQRESFTIVSSSKGFCHGVFYFYLCCGSGSGSILINIHLFVLDPDLDQYWECRSGSRSTGIDQKFTNSAFHKSFCTFVCMVFDLSPTLITFFM